jgi:hypothetical protein
MMYWKMWKQVSSDVGQRKVVNIKTSDEDSKVGMMITGKR